VLVAAIGVCGVIDVVVVVVDDVTVNVLMVVVKVDVVFIVSAIVDGI
jgi:hypothetical protein